SPAEPIAIIQHATFAQQKLVFGTASTIESIAMQQNIGAPAVIVVGRVVNERKSLSRSITNAIHSLKKPETV
ncbi:MAG TPA: hypothetical protein VGD31_08885, partial [Sphingobacteriaceae bacterium]